MKPNLSWGGNWKWARGVGSFL